ncbi:ABC transporter substrate-binding protein [Streptomyces sp. NRRL B-1140]|uniref:ABC transporter substrate-binding protein n=1 Tax=Streptomyces sp. NRRL B-1140 TaxID=1415549 RepID=UPI0006AF6E82|nr:ABC transporter substrate-binding protein [Streptomyces sp. NRRL B-1140]KOV95414.1 ABC transporter substrate-binding protein [Streptomyces sp. NRRL B-1140]
MRSTTRARRRAAAAAAAALPLLLSACSAGSLGSADGDGGATTIKLLVDNAPDNLNAAKQLAKDFAAGNPTIRVSVETRPGGADGDNLIKTRLQTGSMTDIFTYNTGSLFQQIDPAKNLTPITRDPYVKNLDKSFLPQVTVNEQTYGVPFGSALGGGVLYNKKVYSELGLKVPTTWAQFIDNSKKIKAAGIAPVIQTYQDTWTSQLLVLGDFHNVAAAEPDFAEKYTANKVKFATDANAVKGFEHLEQIHDLKLTNSDFASATLVKGLQMLATGKGAQYPMLSTVIGAIRTSNPDQLNDIGFFALPGDDAASNGMTAWFPNAFYVPKSTSGDKLTAVNKFLAFAASPAGCASQAKASTPTGPYLVEGCTLPSDVPTITKDVAAYFTKDAQSPALEFLSPVKGPSLEQISVQVGSGITGARTGAAQYDKDVKKQAQQLGLAGW